MAELGLNVPRGGIVHSTQLSGKAAGMLKKIRDFPGS
jgi:hypothetical protein